MSETKVITGEVRFSYVHVFEPHAVNEGDEKKYSVALLIDKDDTETLDKIEAAIEAAIALGKGKWGGKVPKKLKLPLRDGDEEKEDDEVYENMMFINASSKSKPQVVGREKDDFGNLIGLDEEEFYSGCYGRASINFYPFDVSGNKGVACGLNNLQKLRDGDKLSGGSSAEEDFGDLEDDGLLG